VTEEVVVQGPLRAGSQLSTPRAAAVAGIIFSALLITALVLLGCPSRLIRRCPARG
jgi:hypothetical protein